MSAGKFEEKKNRNKRTQKGTNSGLKNRGRAAAAPLKNHTNKKPQLEQNEEH